MPFYGRHFEPGELQFITTSTYRRLKLFDSDRFRRTFVEVLREVRQETGFLLIGWVLMPEHFHLLIKPVPAEATSRFMQELKKRTAQRIVSARGDGPDAGPRPPHHDEPFPEGLEDGIVPVHIGRGPYQEGDPAPPLATLHVIRGAELFVKVAVVDSAKVSQDASTVVPVDFQDGAEIGADKDSIRSDPMK